MQEILTCIIHGQHLGVLILALRRVLRRVLHCYYSPQDEEDRQQELFHRLLFPFASPIAARSDLMELIIFFFLPSASVIWEDPYLSLAEFQWGSLQAELALIDAHHHHY